MKPERWQEVKNVLAGALERAPEDRRAYLDQSCPDPDLRREVESLIVAHEQGGSNFMEPPAASAGPLQPGTKLGPYEIVSQIGHGGMGVVYRAHDSKLRRDVAIKVLPPAFVNSPDRLSRFQREARLLASLNHPNIASIYGLEDSAGTHALVMELVEGPTLAERIAQGSIPINEALPIAKQIAEGLECAHDHGIVHRDLKPANVKVSTEGTVKILDFGLAKAMETGLPPDDTSDSPTLSQMATEEGVLLGTAAYMAPEQAKGLPVDRRADIWAFGCVLYEMLTGEVAFRSESVTETLAAVLKNEPDWSHLPKNTPPHLRVLLYRCLQKDPKQRLQAIGDARLAIDELLSGVALQIVQTAPTELPRIWKRAWPWAVTTAVLAFVAALFGYLYSVNLSPSAPQVTLAEFPIPPPTQTGFHAGLLGASPALSPDGKQLIFSAPGPNGVHYLWLRSLNSMTARRLDATENTTAPFWSPDGKSIGFGQNGQLMKMSLSGGKPTPLAGVPILRGASWSPQGVIIFSPDPDFGLFRVSASGGKATPATKITSGKGNSDMWPWFLPDGRHFLYAELWDGSNKTTIYLGTLDTLDAKVVVPQASSNAIYASGNILYMEGKALLALPFDPKRLVATGPPTTLAPSVANYGLAALGAFTASTNGTLVYQPSVADAESLSWFDRSGKLLSTLISSSSLQFPKLSPDGHRLNVELNGDLWIYNLASSTRNQFTFDGKSNASTWSPDGKQIVFGSARGSGHYDLYIKPADGSAQAKVLYADPINKYPTDWTSDGKYLLYFGYRSSANLIGVAIDTYVLSLEGVRKPRLLARNRIFGRISPDGHWVAYDSLDWGGYLTSFPVPGGTYRIPDSSVHFPRWSADGNRIYYVTSAGALMQVSVRTHGKAAEIGTPQKLFGGIMSQPGDSFAVAPDGKRILAITAGPGLATHPLTLVQNWPALLKKSAQSAQ